MFFNRKKPQKIRKKKQEFAALFFPLALLLLLLKKKLDERSENERKKNTNYPLFEVWTNLCETWEKRKQKPLRSVCTIEKENITKKQSVGDEVGVALGFSGCHTFAPPLIPAL